MTEVKTDYGDLEKQRKAWEWLENNLKKVINLPWEKFGNIDGAKIPQSLDLVHILHRDIYEYPYLSVILYLFYTVELIKKLKKLTMEKIKK